MVLAVLACAGASGQSPPSATAPSPIKVYVGEFSASETSKTTSLNPFTRQFFKLKVVGVRGVDVAGDSEVAPCGSSSSGAGESSARLRAQNTDRASAPPSAPLFYTVQGTIDIHDGEDGREQQDQSNILLTYELVKTKNCQATTLFQRTRSFSLADVLQNLEEASEDLSEELDDNVAAKATVKVGVIEAVGDPNEKFRATDLLTRFTEQRIADATELRLWNEGSRGDPKYTLTGRVQFSDAGKAGVTAQIQFFADGTPLRTGVAPRTVKATSDALIPFYLDASSAAAKSLSDLFYAQRAGLADLASQTPDALLLKARQLLCVDVREVQLCSPDPRAAILALNEVQQNPERRDHSDVLTLVGRANFQNQQYPAAAEAYDKALQSAENSSIETRLGLLTNAGDAWYEAKEFGKASQRYQEWVRMGSESGSMSAMMRQHVEVPIKLVHSLGLAGQPREAFDALMQCLKVVHTWPTDDPATKALYNNLSRELSGVIDGLPANDLNRAAEKLESELSYDPSLEATGLVQVGRAQAKVNRYDDAVAEYRKALTLKPNDPDAYFNLGYALAHQDQHKAAIVAYRKAIELKPTAVTYNNLGFSLEHVHQFDEAIAEYQKSLEIQPSYSRARYNLADLLWMRNRFKEAETLYREQIQAEPSDTRAYCDLWFLYHQLTKRQEAERVSQDVQRVAAPGDQYVLLILAASKADEGDFTGAAEIYTKLHQQNPEVAQYNLDLASMEIRGGMARHDHALIQSGIDRLEIERREKPTYENCLSLGWAYHVVPEVRNLEKAEQLYRQALTYKPGDARTLSNLIALTLEKGDFQGVISESRKALEVNPGNLDALGNLGYGQFLSGDLPGAMATYDQILEKTPDAPDILICRGEALFWSGDSTKAHEEFARARRILSHTERGGETWTWFIDPRYDASEKPHVVYYATPAQKQAFVELFDGLVYLREMKIPAAMERYEAATHYLANTPDDREVVLKAINDLHRLGMESLPQPTPEFGLGYLFNWLGEKDQARQHWGLYVKSGTDPLGMKEARLHLSHD